MTRQWTEDDEEFVRQNYPFRMSMREIAERFEVSISCVARLVIKLDLPPCPIELRSERVSKTTRQLTKERIVQEIKAIAQSEPINSSYVQQHYGSLHTAARLRFGGWQSAVEAAGFDYDEVNLYSGRVTWSRKDIVERVLELHAQGEDLKASTIINEHSDVFNAARRDPSLGSWRAAIEAAGLSYDDVQGERWGSEYQGEDGRVHAPPPPGGGEAVSPV